MTKHNIVESDNSNNEATTFPAGSRETSVINIDTIPEGEDPNVSTAISIFNKWYKVMQRTNEEFLGEVLLASISVRANIRHCFS